MELTTDQRRLALLKEILITLDGSEQPQEYKQETLYMLFQLFAGTVSTETFQDALTLNTFYHRKWHDEILERLKKEVS